MFTQPYLRSYLRCSLLLVKIRQQGLNISLLLKTSKKLTSYIKHQEDTDIRQ